MIPRKIPKTVTLSSIQFEEMEVGPETDIYHGNNRFIFLKIHGYIK